MNQTVVDARGMLCPQPLILTKKALLNLSPGEQMRVLIDNETSLHNVTRFLQDNAMQVSHTRQGELYTLLVTKAHQELTHPQEQSYCTAPARAPVICIRSQTMGEGDSDLGTLLMKAFVNTIGEMQPLPATIVLYNSGIMLAVDNSGLDTTLRELEQRGVGILVCGTCVEFYGKKGAIHLGTISNMYSIMETLTQAGHVIYP
jgi:selenium metabolism protein YedF